MPSAEPDYYSRCHHHALKCPQGRSRLENCPISDSWGDNLEKSDPRGWGPPTWQVGVKGRGSRLRGQKQDPREEQSLGAEAVNGASSPPQLTSPPAAWEAPSRVHSKGTCLQQHSRLLPETR